MNDSRVASCWPVCRRSSISLLGREAPSDSFTNVNNSVFFVATTIVHGRELWRTDGTTAGTVMVKDINPGVGSSQPSQLTNVNGTLFFSAFVGASGYELWRSDGTAAGTVLVKDIHAGGADSNPTQLTNINGTLFFRANDGSTGGELWKSDGTAAGTVLVKDIQSGAPVQIHSCSPTSTGHSSLPRPATDRAVMSYGKATAPVREPSSSKISGLALPVRFHHFSRT